MTIKPLNLKQLKTVPLSQRKVETEDINFGSPYSAGGSFADFLCSLPDVGCAKKIFQLRDTIVDAHRRGRTIVLGVGGHVIDVGLNPLIVRLIELRIISALALTGAAMLQDVEIALAGHTIRYRDQELQEGHFCVTEETGRLINEAINFGTLEGWGIGESVGRRLLDQEVPNADHSILANAVKYGTTITVHPAIGADAFNLHPTVHGESLGTAGLRDFSLLGGVMAELSGGVLLNIASNTILPRVFLQAVDAARNLGNRIEKVTAVVIDQGPANHAYEDVVQRLSQPQGTGIWLQGPDEIMLPLLFAAVNDAIEAFQ